MGLFIAIFLTIAAILYPKQLLSLLLVILVLLLFLGLVTALELMQPVLSPADYRAAAVPVTITVLDVT